MINYPALYKKIYSSKRLTEALRHTDRIVVLFVSVAFVTCIVFSFFFQSPLRAILYMIVSGVPLLAVSLMRRFFNFPRPHEIYDFGELGFEPPATRRGCSFPSRHSFSATLIGVLMLEMLFHLGVLILVLGAIMSVTRVLLGFHFVRDAVVGTVIGAVMGAAGVLAIVLI